ncbi:ATP-binding protein [Nonomuraea sp. NPDC049625]|uniref:ATP-binding protein n=1 Tax=Nonomuraea sp. NPDC049625 TaxID=3155775 RepID=UPI003420B93A
MNAQFELRCPVSADLGWIRDLIRIFARNTGLTGERLEDLVMAVNEAITNVFDHGGRGHRAQPPARPDRRDPRHRWPAHRRPPRPRPHRCHRQQRVRPVGDPAAVRRRRRAAD